VEAMNATVNSTKMHGVEPRWLGMDTSDCPVAMEPSIFHSSGADELKRFLTGARRRGETALVVAVIGDVTDDSARHPLSDVDASVHLGNLYTSVAGRRLPSGTRPSIAADLDPADRDLAIQLLTRQADAPWWALELHDATEYRVGGFGGPTTDEAEGELHPILCAGSGRRTSSTRTCRRRANSRPGRPWPTWRPGTPRTSSGSRRSCGRRRRPPNRSGTACSTAAGATW
jgi:hypothetical protein